MFRRLPADLQDDRLHDSHEGEDTDDAEQHVQSLGLRPWATGAAARVEDSPLRS